KVVTAGGSAQTFYVDDLYERRIDDSQRTTDVYKVYVNGSVVAQKSVAPDPLTGRGLQDWKFLHPDRLSSPALTTTPAAQPGTMKLGERFDFDAYGQRRDTNLSVLTPPEPPADVKVGFTEHDHDDELGLIDMGGRFYDPVIHRFLSPDPLTSDPFHGLA